MNKAKRKQFPLQYFVCSTVHKVLGETCPRLCTRISSDRNYSLWEREMLLVLLSRVQTLADLFFVGDRQDTLSAIEKLLKLEDESGVKLDSLLERLDILSGTGIVPPELQIFDPIVCEMPEDHSGVVLLCVSTSNRSVSKIMFAKNVKEKITEVNTNQSLPHSAFRPWVPVVVVSGFPGEANENQHWRSLYGEQWVYESYSNGAYLNLESMVQKGKEVHEWYRRNFSEHSVIFRQILKTNTQHGTSANNIVYYDIAPIHADQ